MFCIPYLSSHLVYRSRQTFGCATKKSTRDILYATLLKHLRNVSMTPACNRLIDMFKYDAQLRCKKINHSSACCLLKQQNNIAHRNVTHR